jgi:hypothetical protein
MNVTPSKSVQDERLLQAIAVAVELGAVMPERDHAPRRCAGCD